MPKSLKAMEAEVEAYCRAKGWYDKEVPFLAAVCLLHEEAAEAGHAWRTWGLDDATAGSDLSPGGHPLAKPEGVGSELADVLIRLLDDNTRYGLDALARLDNYPQGSFEFDGHFLVNVRVLHKLIAAVEEETASRDLAAVMAYTFQLARFCGLNLHHEYERKMRYNRDVRPYRHGQMRA